MGSSSQTYSWKSFKKYLRTITTKYQVSCWKNTFGNRLPHLIFFFQTTLNVMFQPQLARQTPKIHPAFYHLKKNPPLDRKNNVTHPSRVWHVPAFQYATNERARIHRQIGSPQDGNLHDGSHRHLAQTLPDTVVVVDRRGSYNPPIYKAWIMNEVKG